MKISFKEMRERIQNKEDSFEDSARWGNDVILMLLDTIEEQEATIKDLEDKINELEE